MAASISHVTITVSLSLSFSLSFETVIKSIVTSMIVTDSSEAPVTDNQCKDYP